MKSMNKSDRTSIKWVISGKIAGSPYPNFKDIRFLQKYNIKMIVNLTRHGLPTQVKNQLLSHRITWKRFPIPDFGVPNQETINKYLQCVCEVIQREEAVLTHCIAGCGRTGTMIGLYLITHGHTFEHTIEIIKQVLGEYCPETQDQIQVLNKYRKKCPNFSKCKGSI
jgi:atypical dual specificity phosphatase